MQKNDNERAADVLNWLESLRFKTTINLYRTELKAHATSSETGRLIKKLDNINYLITLVKGQTEPDNAERG